MPPEKPEGGPRPGVRVSRAETADLPQILEIQREAFAAEARAAGDPNIAPLTETLEEAREDFGVSVFLKAEDQSGRVLGSVRARAAPGGGRVARLSVRPACQGLGAGGALLRAAEEALPPGRLELFTRRGNGRALRLYERLGWKVFREEAASDSMVFVWLEKVKAPPGRP